MSDENERPPADKTEKPARRVTRDEGEPGRPNIFAYAPGERSWETAYGELRKLLETGGAGDTFVSVWIRGEGDKQYRYLTEIEGDSFDPKGVIEQYGGGQYQFRLKKNNRYGERFYMAVDPRIKGVIDTPKNGANGAPDPWNYLLKARDFLGATGDKNDVTKEILLRLIEAQTAKPSDDTMKNIIALLTACAPIVAAIISRPQVSPSDKMIELLAQRPNQDIATMLQAFKELRNLSTDRPAKEDGSPSTLDRVIGMLPTLLPAAASAFMPKVHPMPPTLTVETAPVSPEMPAMPPQGSTPPPAPTPAQQAHIRQTLMVYGAMLEKAAKGNAPVDTWADLIDQMTDDDQWGALLSLLQQPNWQQVITGYLPAMAQYPDWLNALREELLAGEESAEAPPEAEQRVPGEIPGPGPANGKPPETLDAETLPPQNKDVGAKAPKTPRAPQTRGT